MHSPRSRANPVLVALLASLLLPACSSAPNEADAPQRKMKVKTNRSRSTAAMRLFRTGQLIERWLQNKARIPRTPELSNALRAMTEMLAANAREDEDELRQVLEDDDAGPRARGTAAMALGFTGSDRALEVLLRTLEGTPPAALAAPLLVGLGILAHRDTPLGPVLDYLIAPPGHQPPAGIRVRAAYCALRIAMAGGGSRADGERMIAALGDEDYRVRSQIALALAGTGVRCPPAPGALLALLDDSVPRVVTAACKGLGILRHKAAGPRLIQILDESSDVMARLAAREALRAIYGVDLGEHANAWRQELSHRAEQNR